MRIRRTAHQKLSTYACAIAAMLAALLLVPATYAQTGHFTSFDAPGAGHGARQGTFPYAINRQGWIAGTVVVNPSVDQGFLRSPNGTFISVIAPGAVSTVVLAMNESHQVVGFGLHTSGNTYAFFRDASGHYSPLAVSGAFSTSPAAINDHGAVSGFDQDATGVHGFVWDAQHGYTVFDVPGSSPGSTYAGAINNAGTVVGRYYDSTLDTYRGFTRNSNGQFTTFDAEQGGNDTAPMAINASNQITGSGNNGLYGFVRGSGNDEVFSFPGAQVTAPTAINDGGVIVGWELSGSMDAPFERDASGAINLINLPFSYTASYATGINAGGTVTGNYTDSTGTSHGWVGIP